MRYNFLCIFKTLGRMQQKKNIFFTCSFLEEKKLRGLRGIFLKQILKNRKTKLKKSKKVILCCFFIRLSYYFSFFSYSVKPNGLTRLDRPSWV